MLNNRNLNLLLHEDYVTKVVCRRAKGKYSDYPINQLGCILKAVEYSSDDVTLEIHPIENKWVEYLPIWLDELYISMPKDNPRIYLYVRDCYDQSCKLQLEFYLLSKAEVNLRTIYGECFFQ